jgi:DNA replication protein DnaC
MLAKIPVEYRGLDLDTISPDLAKHPKQGSLLELVKADPGASLMLSGKNGCGKTLVGWLMYRRAVEDDRPAVFLPVAELITQYRLWETSSDEAPHVDIDSTTLREDKRRWLIGLDEFEKARPTPFAAEKLFLLLDAVYSHRHQLIITTNLEKEALRDHWSDHGQDYGVSIMRRVLELHGMTRVPMF